MGETDGENATADRPSEEPEVAPVQDTLQLPVQKKRKLKSPTPGSLRGRSATPIHGRSQTPFTLYMTRRSATPSTWRSITPFLKREEKEKTPFELGKDIKTQTTCNKAVFDRALIMDISEPEDIQKPVRYITSDLSVIDRAAVMDVSNVEVIYVVEEYEEYEDEEEVVEEVKPKKKGKGPRKGRTPRKSLDKDQSPSGISETDGDIDYSREREDSVDLEDLEEQPKKGKKKAAPKKKEKKEKSPSPKLTLKLEIGGGQKASKKMFEQQQQQQQQAAGPKPPPKKSKLVLQMEEQARAAAKAAEEAAIKMASKPKGETYEERQKRLQAEKEEKERIEAQLRAAQEAQEAEEREQEEEDGLEDAEEATEGGEEGDERSAFDESASYVDSYADENVDVDEEIAAEEEKDEVKVLPKKKEKRRGSGSSDEYTRPDPYDERLWKQIAEQEGEEFMQQMRKYSLAQRRSEKELDEEWQRRREKARHPHFINFLTDRTVETGQSVRLACAVGGPELSVKWFKDGRQLERDATHRIINNNNILALEIINTTILDSGEYSCVISNVNDEVTSSCIVTIYEVFKDEPQPPTFRLIREYYHLRDDELTIEVHVHGVPRPIVTWWRGAFQVKPSFKFTMLEEAHGVCKLLIYKPSNKDAGTYTCKAINSSGEVNISHTVEVAKNRHFHVHGIFYAHGRMGKEKENIAKRAMEEALQSKAESDKKRAAAEETKGKSYRASPEPLVSPKQKLKFATQLRDRMALEGSTVKFVCTIIGPQPTCSWMKDDKRIVVGGNVRNLSEEGKAILEISNVSAESSGVYKCIAKNEHCEIETSCYFKAYSAQTDGDEQEPMFALPLRDVYHSSQNDLIIDTKVRGNPRPKISWVKDNLPVVLDDRKVQIEHLDGVCELIINKPTSNDSGVYTCIAENKLGTQKTTHSVVVEVVQTSRRSSATGSLMAESESSGPITGSGTGSKSQKEDTDKERKPPKLKKKPDDETEGTYERRTKMPDPSPKQQLYFIANLSNRYVAEGSKVKMQAVIGGPDATTKWQKDGQNVTYGTRVLNRNRDGLAVLEFTNAMPEDSGIYSIHAQNEFCKITTSAMLHVYQPKVNADVQPTFIRSLKETYHLNTNELILETAVRGQPTPEIQWFKDSIEIQNGGRYQILEHPDGACELVIDKPDNKDSGKYVVKAENREGKMEISHYVLFEGKAHHIADNIHGVFHADPSLLRPKVAEVEQPKAKEGPEGAESASETEDSKGKRRARRKSKKGGDEEEEPASSAAEYSSDAASIKEKRREKVIGIHFATNVKDRVVAEGSKVKISCFLNSKEPQVKWFKNGDQIVNSPKIRARYSEGLCLLEITSVAIEDSGEYQCCASDETGKASTSCKLEVYANPGTGDVPPTFTRNIKDTFHGKINELQLDVHVRGLPTPTVNWVKDGVKIENSDKYQQVDHDDGTCELFINDPVSADSGKYVCQAENREGKAEIVHMVTVEPRIVRPVSPPREARPPAKPVTEETAEEMQEGDKKSKKAKEDDETAGSRREAPPPPDLKKRLYFRNFLSNRTVKSGSNVKWMVNIYGPEPVARWFHGENPISFGPKSKMSCQDGIAWLNLIEVTEENAGEYILKVKGPENEITSTCNLFVYSTGAEDLIGPVFTVFIKDTYSINDNELVLDCRVRGKPLPEIQWMKGNDMIYNNEKYHQIDQADGYSKLIINNPTEKDSGLYICVARNEVSENKISHQVDFKGRERFTLEKTHGFFHRDPNKPHFLVPLGNQTVCAGGTAVFSAEFLQTNSPIEVQWFRNRKVLAGEPNVTTFMERGVYTLAIQNAQPETEGTYTCRAWNAFGRIESHVNVDVAVGVPKEERPPLFLSRPDTEMKIAVGDPFSISFRIAGDPKPKLTLFKGTKDITKTDRVCKEASDDFIRFTIQKTQISDSGTYFVVARNNFGTDRIFVTVTVMPRTRSETPTLPRWGQPLESFPDVSYFRDPPGPISTEPLVVDSGPTHISLSWGKPTSVNSAPVIAYKIDAWIVGHEGGAIWKELGLSPINSFDAFNLKPNVEYHFRVTPKNRYGWGPSVQTSNPLQVGGAECLPEFVKILSGQVKALLGSQFNLECTVRGSPRPLIIWYKDGMRLSSTSNRIKVKQLGSNCTLQIACVCEVDAGRYTCEATNSKGRVSTFARLQVVADAKIYQADSKLKEILHSDSGGHLGETLPIFAMRLRDRRVQVTYPVRLTCQVVGFPTPTVSWLKDDNEVFSTRQCIMTEEGQFYTLELPSTCLDDSGTYTCTAKNEMGSVSCHCSLVVDKGIRAYISPEFYMPLDPVYIFQEGQEIRLSAKVEAYPAVGVSWHRNGVKLRPSRKILATLDCSGFVELVIAEATQRDSGIYVCVASNVVGRVESSCRVVIEEADEEERCKIPAIKTSDMPYSEEPMFVVKPRSSEAFEGDTVIIFCEVVGDPKPEVVWLRDFLNPEYYKDAPHFRRICEGPEYRLEIPSAKLDFTGTYSLIASNCHGEAKAVISLQIYAKDILNQRSMEKGSIRHGNVETLPRFVRQLRDLRCCDGDAITLECHVEALPEPIIIWEKDGRIISSDKDYTMSYDGIKATLSIPRVYPEDEGEYTCLAKNSVGRTLSSACIIVDVPEEKENMLHRQLSRPTGLLSASSTPRSTPRSTPNRSFSPMRLSYRNTSIEFGRERRGVSAVRGMSTTGHHLISAPKFYTIPHSRVVEEGDNVRFQCAIAGHPLPWATWDKDGRIVTPTTRISVKDVDDMRLLDIEEVTFDDAGLYRITLENDYGRIEATARLDVIGSSRYSKSPSMRGIRSSSSKRNTYLYRRIMGPSTAIGGRMALAAGFRGSSVPACKFYHNEVELEENERVHIEVWENHEARLFIENVSEADEGVYMCVIQAGDDYLSTATRVIFNDVQNNLSTNKERRRPTSNIIKDLPQSIKTYEGETIDLSFELECKEPYFYKWTRNGEELPDCVDFNYIDHSNGVLCLRIHDAFDIDSGIYACTLTAADGSICSTSCELNVFACSQSSENANLSIIKSPLPALAKLGQDVTFCANVYPRDADANWFICGRILDELDDSLTYSVESSTADGVRILHLHNVDCKHSGEVLLSVTHPGKRAPSVRAYSSLLVIPEPIDSAPNTPQEFASYETVSTPNSTDCTPEFVPVYILEGPKDCTALIGGSVRLSVQFEGYPHPDVKWFKAGRPITEHHNIAIATTNDRSTLLITDIMADDSGKYTVEVRNELSNDVAVASVAVEGPPDPPSGKPSVSKGSDRVAVAWCGPPYDGGCIVTGFIIEMQQLAGNIDKYDDIDSTGEWQKIASVTDSLAYTVKNLRPGRVYRFRVRATNIQGSSEPGLPSEIVELTTSEDSIEDFQKPINVQSGGDFRSRFDVLEELGKGRFGVVFKVQERDKSRQILAAKVIKCIKARDRQKVQEEISIMRSLQHPKLLQLAASFESSREIVMVMEYITGGELFERVVADDFTLTERDCILFLRQVCEGVAYMHSQSIVHLDLKPENIMCHTRTSHQIKIIDFGLAQRLSTDDPVRVLFGTPEFIPPEIISYEPIGFQSDMWSVGVICYVLLSGLSPFMGDSDVETFSNITRADYDFEDDAFDCVSQEAKDFISNLLIHRKENRWTAKQCLESNWLTHSHVENLNNIRICTDKLKKFIIRRKWQKTGNAIRALGRMANLSASRRNSAVSTTHGSTPNSPRPSISGISMLNPSISVHMSSLHEEDDDFSAELPSLDVNKIHLRNTLTARDKSQCSERSDSGFSECSSCSGVPNGSCHCPHTTATDAETKGITHMSADETTLSMAIPHIELVTKLEKIAKQVEENTLDLINSDEPLKYDDNHNVETFETRELTLDNSVQTVKNSIPNENKSESSTLKPKVTKCGRESPSNEDREKSILNTSRTPIPASKLQPTRSTFIRTDFTNTIQMRKKSLENNLNREKIKQPIALFEQPGKVSMLKSKFNQTTTSACFSPGNDCVSNKACNESMDLAKQKCVFNRLNCKKTNVTGKTPSISMPNSPLPVRSAASGRLSGRVKEATERLSQQHTVASAQRVDLRRTPP